MSPKMRYYQPDDYSQVKEILTEAGLFCAPMDTEEKLKAKIKRQPDSILLAVEDTTVIGTIFIVEDGWMVGFLRFAVRKIYRKKGIGTMLLEKAIQQVKEKGYETAELTVDIQNVHLQHYYEKFGFQKYKPYTYMYLYL